MQNCALYSANFTMAVVSVDDRRSILLLDHVDADALKLCVERLKAEPDGARLSFYRDLIGNRPLRGPDGILMQLGKNT